MELVNTHLEDDSTLNKSTRLRDKIRGMFAGLMLGDASGAPFEFYKWNRNTVYTGRLEIAPYRQRDARRFPEGQREVISPIGSVTDDTQMTIALIKCLIKNKGKYDRDEAIIAYTRWVQCKPQDLGTNTRYLFSSKAQDEDRLLKTYYTKINKVKEDVKSGNTDKISLSNGALMRCSPLALIKGWNKACIDDVNLSNPYKETRDVNLTYLTVLRMILLGNDSDSLFNVIDMLVDLTDDITIHKNVRLCILQALNFVGNDIEERDVGTKSKGLATNALYCAIGGLLLNQGYSEAIRWVITQNSPNSTGVGDTDTNAAIAGALIGAYMGFDELMSEDVTRDNWKILLKTASKVKGPIKDYVPYNFDELVDDYISVLPRELFLD
jgi:ADP-ribosylglycohydrolase